MPIKPEDYGTLATAIASGKIDPKNHDTWLNALGTDREGTKRALASMPAVPINLRTGTRVKASAATTTSQTGPRVTGSDGNLERIEVGREPTQQEKLDDFEYRLTNGRLGARAPEHIVYYRDKSGPRLIDDNPDGSSAHWALPGE